MKNSSTIRAAESRDTINYALDFKEDIHA